MRGCIGLLSIVGALSLLAGCSTYVAPNRGANLSYLGVEPDAQIDATTPGNGTPSPSSSSRELDQPRPLPTARFPTQIALVRIQAPGYESRTIRQTHGGGAFTVVVTRDVESEDHIERLNRMPMVDGIAKVSSILVPQQLQSDKDLRRIADRLGADMLLVYTFDTVFYTEDQSAPLAVITLGFAPTVKANVITTASAVLMDTRTGYIYGLADAVAEQNEQASTWSSPGEIDRTRRENEAEAFDKLVGEIEDMWAGVITRYNRPTTQETR